MLTDITKRGKDKDRLRAAEERFRLISEMTSDYAFAMTISKDGRTHLEWITDSFLRDFGYTYEEINGLPGGPSGLTHPEDRENGAKIRGRLLAEAATIITEHRLVAKDGSTRWTRMHLRSFRDATSGEVTRIIGAAKDITKEVEANRMREEAEARLRQSERLESVGQLAGGVAHDFNNLLAVILNYASFVRDDLEAIMQHSAEAEIAPILSDLDQVRLAAERGADLTRRLLVFSRRGVVKPQVMNINDVVSDMDKLLRRTLGEHLRMVTVCSPGLWNVRIDPGQIEQVLMNLVVNARDAMPDSGILEIRTSNLQADNGHTQAELPEGEYVCLSVSDSGSGMPKQVLERVFEPFFSTKPKGKGTGLGLATVYGIVKEAGGTINLYSEPGLGTTARLYLPRELAASETETNPPSAVVPLGHGETVLLVEDDASVRDSTMRILEQAGYTVVAAAGPKDAMERQPDDLRLLLTDVVMEGASGKELAAAITDARPDVKVIYMSGYTYEVIAARGVIDEDVVLVEKPFTAEALLRAVGTMLN